MYYWVSVPKRLDLICILSALRPREAYQRVKKLICNKISCARAIKLNWTFLVPYSRNQATVMRFQEVPIGLWEAWGRIQNKFGWLNTRHIPFWDGYSARDASNHHPPPFIAAHRIAGALDQKVFKRVSKCALIVLLTICQ